MSHRPSIWTGSGWSRWHALVGMVAAVPETPTAPPVHARPERLVHKQRASASVAVLNHVSFPAMIEEFMAAATPAGLTIPVIASVAVFTDRVKDQHLVDGGAGRLWHDPRLGGGARRAVGAGTLEQVADEIKRRVLDVGIDGVIVNLPSHSPHTHRASSPRWARRPGR